MRFPGVLLLKIGVTCLVLLPAARSGECRGPVALQRVASVKVSSDDNIYLSRTGTAAVITTLNHDLKLRIEGRRLQAMAGHEVEVLRFSRARYYNDAVHQALDAGGSYSFGEGKMVRIEDRFVITTDPATSELTDRTRRNRNDARLLAEWALGRRFFIGANVLHVTHYYLDDYLDDLLNRKELSAGPRFGFNLGPKTRSYVRAGYQAIDYDHALSTRDNSTLEAAAGFEVRATGKITGKVEAGVFMRDYETTTSTVLADSATSLSLAAQVEWNAPRGVKLSLTGLRAPVEAIFNRYYVANSLGAGASKEIMRRWTVSVLGGYGVDQYPDPIWSGTSAEEREDSISQFGMKVGYQAHRNVQCQAGFLRRTRDSNLDRFDYENDITSVTVRLDF